jgi:hypothetical protein
MLLNRFLDDGTVTFGELQLDDATPIAVTLELPWKDNEHNVSRIPAGTYVAKRFQSPHLGYELFQLQDVPERSGVDIHKGNTVKDTNGCILLGTKRGVLDGEQAILGSTAAFAKFMDLLEDQDEITLVIQDAL